ncbi:uncharacterized protein L201_007551 [Kwoniella dendrophila CBS 6074]|uniref:Beta-lactamase-related domain-containing protein n=1 Tax=Kwoniella dendrophila CBS 6074 TaxID=1295534 RepID=A0AAX4K6V0_9TREE
MLYFIRLLTAFTILVLQVQSVPFLSTRQSSSSTNTSNATTTIINNTLIAKIDDIRARWGVKGINVALVASPDYIGNKTGHSQKEWSTQSISLGSANRHNHAFEDDTLYAIGSNSKHFAAVSIGLLIANNTKLSNGQLLSLTTKVKDILPEFGLMDGYAGENADLVDLMSMRSGLPRHDHLIGPSKTVPHLLSGLPITDGFVHENINYQTCISAVQAFLQAGGGTNLTACAGEIKSIGWWDHTDGVRIATTGGVITTGQDMIKWLKEELSPTVLPSFIVPATTTSWSVLTNQPAIPGITSIYSYGLGQYMYTYRGYTIHTHDGSVFGQLSHNIRIPDLGIGMVIIVNDQSYGDSMGSLVGNMILDAVLDLEPINWELKTVKGLAGLLDLTNTDSQSSTNSPLTSSNTTNSTTQTRPAPDRNTIIGTYTDKAYGDWKVQPISDLQNISTISALNQTLTQYGLTFTDQSYFAHDDQSSFITHYVFTPSDGPLFNITPSYITPTYDENSDDASGLTAITYSPGTAVFKDNGMGLFNIWQQGNTLQPSIVVEDNIEQNAEVWFKKQ